MNKIQLARTSSLALEEATKSIANKVAEKTPHRLVIASETEEESKMVTSYEEATAKIANANEIREMKQESNYVQSYMGTGLGHADTVLQPLVLSR